MLGVHGEELLRIRLRRYLHWHAEPHIADRTSFFAAAAVVTRVMMRLPWTGFLLPLSGILEEENARRAAQIRAGSLYRHCTIETNTIDFIRFEQGLVQRHLDHLQRSAPRRYGAQVRAFNTALSLLHATRLRYGLDESFVAGVVDAVRALGESIDLADRTCREVLGRHIARYASDAFIPARE